MLRPAVAVLAAAVALAVPPLLIVDGIRVVTSDWYVRLLYDHGVVPRDRYGLTSKQRKTLAVAGLHSILPGYGEGIGLLEEAKLPGGRPAFNSRELRHLQDVRTLLRRAYLFQLVTAIVIAALALVLGLRRTTRAVVPVALRRGALLSIGLAAVVGVVSAIEYSAFSTLFHSLFFSGASWRFADTDTLRRLYPDRFWLDTAIVIGVIVVAQAVVLFALARWWARRMGARQAFRARTRTQSP